MKLFTRFFLILLAFALLPVLATGIWLATSNQAVRENATLLHQQVASLSVDLVETSIKDMNRALVFIEDIERAGGNKGNELNILQRAMATYSGFSLLSILDASGKETLRMADPALFPDQTPVDRSQDPIVKKVAATGQVTVGGVTLFQERPLVAVAHPLPEGRTLYVLYSLKPLWQRVSRQNFGRGGKLVLLDAEGRPLPGLAREYAEGWAGLSQDELEKGWLERIYTKRGVMVGAAAATPSLGWWALSLQPREEAFAASDSFALQAASFIVGLAVLVALGAFWVTGALTRPLIFLIAGADRISKNQFNQPVPEIGWGELNQLSHTFNKMSKTLAAYQEIQVERLLSEKAKVEALVHTIPDGVVLAGFDGEVFYLNAVARLVLGMGFMPVATPKPGTKGPAPMAIKDVLKDPALRDLAEALIKKRTREKSIEHDLKAPDGTRIGVFSCRGVTVRVENKDVGILLILRDITAQKELEHMKEEFFHAIVHDIRSPLTSIEGYVKLMIKGRELSERERTFVGYINESTQRLRKLVTDILDTAKLESGTMELALAPVEAAQVLQDMHGQLSVQAEAKGIHLVTQLGPAPHAAVCDRGLIERVIINLIGNALKFTPSGGSITLTIGAAEGMLEFSIKDTGAGIPPDALEAVFEKFKQLKEGAATKSGYGLGLSICKKVVELHGGRIWVESVLGKGSDFKFRLPYKPAGAAAAAPAAKAKA